jgi:hypothetical protein|tara:strand:- start:2948 stop:3922 length:975 start_codon:yes stop_codon:yes gene_type:complete
MAGTFRDLIDEVLDLGSHGTGDDFEGMVKAAINRTYRRVLQKTRQETSLREFSLATVADTSKYGMPLYVKRILNIEDPTNKRVVYDISWREYDDLYAGNTTTGDPTRAYVLGSFGTAAQNASASVFNVVSSNTADANNRYVTITGFVSGHLTSETITLNGLVTATGSTSFDANGIERIVVHSIVNVDVVGTITVKDASGNTMASIPPTFKSPTHLWVEFYPIPDGVITYTVRCEMRKPDLVEDEDWPEIDEDFHNIIVWGAAADVLPNVGKGNQADRLRRDYEEGLMEALNAQGDHPGRIRTFADLDVDSKYPRRPLVKGVDFV